jgi:hypothetical protein
VLDRGAELFENLHAWRLAELALAETTDDARRPLEAKADRLRANHQMLYTSTMNAKLTAFGRADQKRRFATPSTPHYDAALRESAGIAAEISEQATRVDREAPPTRQPAS